MNNVFFRCGAISLIVVALASEAFVPTVARGFSCPNANNIYNQDNSSHRIGDSTVVSDQDSSKSLSVDPNNQGRAELEEDNDQLANIPPVVQPPTRSFKLIHLIQLVLTAGIIFWGYSLVMSGKHGFGWKVVLGICAALLALVRLAASLFNEVTADNEVGDWDDDSEVKI